MSRLATTTFFALLSLGASAPPPVTFAGGGGGDYTQGAATGVSVRGLRLGGRAALS
jgi:hypothetical protein